MTQDNDSGGTTRQTKAGWQGLQTLVIGIAAVLIAATIGFFASNYLEKQEARLNQLERENALPKVRIHSLKVIDNIDNQTPQGQEPNPRGVYFHVDKEKWEEILEGETLWDERRWYLIGHERTGQIGPGMMWADGTGRWLDCGENLNCPDIRASNWQPGDRVLIFSSLKGR